MFSFRSLNLACGLSALLAATSVFAGTVTYQFNNTLASDESGGPSLVSVDPLAKNGFTTANVFGSPRTVFQWTGNATPINQQAGLTLNTTGLLTPTSYTMELVFEFTQDTGTWRRIFDTTGRMADTGFYVEPGDRLQVYNDVTGTTLFTTNVFHYIALTVSNNSVKAYLDGKLELNSPTDKLNIQDPVVSYFIDNNLGGPAQTEFANGEVALIRMTDVALSDQEIASRGSNPFVVTTPPTPAVPLPAAALLFTPGAALAAFAARRMKRMM
jgi:hypothetical protein